VLNVTFTRDASAYVLQCRGEVDDASWPTLNAVLEGVHLDFDSDVVVDLSELRFIDASGLRTFLQAERMLKLQGRKLRIRGASPHTRKLFEIVRLDPLLDDE
jgi:anti-sigma B factor antagonist